MNARYWSAILLSSLAISLPLRAASIEELSRKFLGLPYGAGAHIVDKDLMAPSYDCMTYVETVMAYYLETKEDPASSVLNRIRYFEGKRDEVVRKHFVETDWIQDNQRLGFVKDITKTIMPTAPSVSAVINKEAWFSKVHPELSEAFLKSSLPKKIPTTIDYIPLDDSVILLDRIPDGAVIIFIQDDENKLVNLIKTQLIVGHMGLAVRVNGQLKLRQADSGMKIIRDMDFAKAMIASKKHFRGIAVLELVKK